MTEDGRDWGERCVDMYNIVDKVILYCICVWTMGMYNIVYKVI